ncbi:MAG TPA: aminotransferase class V-fold PLP-dependent enzyme [Polyangia bacterium]
MSDLSRFRSCFPVGDRCHYLNHAGVGPTSTRVRQAVLAWLDDLAANGVINLADWLRREREVRALAGRLIGAEPDEIAFVRSTSHGLSAFAEGLTWSPGDEIAVCLTEEYPANLYPWMNLERRGVMIRPVESREGGVTVEAVAAACGPRTRLVAVSSVQFGTGYRTELESLGAFCYERGVVFCVDGSQSVGAFPMDVKAAHIDLLSTNSHEWQLGLTGIGFAYVSGELLPHLRPVSVGWKSIKTPLDVDHPRFDLREDAAKLEEGTPNTMGIMGLGAALDLLFEVGIAPIAGQISEWLAALDPELRAWGCDPRPGREHRAGILTFSPPRGSADAFVASAQAAGIALTARRGRVRVSPHFYNGELERDALISFVRRSRA